MAYREEIRLGPFAEAVSSIEEIRLFFIIYI